ncbi:Melanopsin-A [Liparis tanakae]|uniref:Melanopsin-A n=1 Tax=Liparis tanakae TaxID=230148 RepID=A0A4Z2EBA7_9TELE|nr:Melanopsin-A [Liparis tanakae]
MTSAQGTLNPPRGDISALAACTASAAGLCRTLSFSPAPPPCTLLPAMVVLTRTFNFSTADSSLSSGSLLLGTVAPLRDSQAAHSPGGLSRGGHTAVAVCLGFILVAGILNNFLALLIFAKFRSLWTPINVLLLNISVSDILVCVFGTPFSFAASLHGRWLIGERGCKWYGFANSLFGECDECRLPAQLQVRLLVLLIYTSWC